MYSSSSYPSADQSYGYEYKADPNIESQLRINFVRKVFGIVASQLLVTALFVFFATFTRIWTIFSGFFSILAIIGVIVTGLVLALSRTYSRTYPTNYILLSIFTLCEAYLVSLTTTYYDPFVVLQATILTAGIVSALAFYAFTSKKEITYYGGFLLMLSTGILMVSLLSIFVRSQFLYMIYVWLSTIAAGLYLIYDIKAIMGRDRLKVDLDDYVKGALTLYLDIIRIFIKVLQILGEKQEKKEEKRKR
jgi:FtsH-binding integral membrane protein